MVVDTLSFRDRLVWRRRFKGAWAEAPVASRKVLLLKPLTYMNQSGESVAPLAAFYRIRPEEILVVYDEVELELGVAAVVRDGGLAGHQGLKSLAAALGTRDFHRLRIGVSRPRRGTVASHVLGRFTEDERAALPRILEGCARILEEIIQAEGDPAAVRGSRIHLLEDL